MGDGFKCNQTGDFTTGNLELNTDDDDNRVLGCTDLSLGKSFSIVLGDYYIACIKF